MKNLSRIFFCIFIIAIFYSCEPEELSSDINNEVEFSDSIYMSTGNQEGDIIE